MPGKRQGTGKKQQAFRMRLQGITLKAIAAELKVSPNTISRWEKGWVDRRGRKHRGWLAELEKVKGESEKDEYMAGLALKKERLKAYDELAQMAIEKIKVSFPNITAKTSSDMKALLSEVRELCRLMAMEQGNLHPGGQTIVAVKNDITIEELSQRYRNTVAGVPESIDVEEELDRTGAKEQVVYTERHQVGQDILRIAVSQLKLPVRVKDRLNELRVYTLGDILQYSQQELLSLRNFGVTSLYDLRQELAKYHLDLRKRRPSPLSRRVDAPKRNASLPPGVARTNQGLQEKECKNDTGDEPNRAAVEGQSL